ncbi:MAG: serine/threonine-protein kinase [Myxococcota bacterium]
MAEDSEPDDALLGVDPLNSQPLQIAKDRALGELEARLFGRKPRKITIGRYELGDVIGEGSFGVVHRASDPLLDREVAIKILRGTSLDDEAKDALVSESQAIAALNHPNVIRIFDVGTVTGRGRDADLYLVLELVEGETLAAWLTRKQRSSSQILRLMIMAARGLAAAHQADIVHLDFKPANVLVDGETVARVLDFGLARHLPRAASLTDSTSRSTGADRAATGRTQIIVGTPRYMSPETHVGEPPGPAADQYAWGLSCIEALTEGYPFPGHDRKRLVARKHQGLSPGELVQLGVPKALCKALSRAIAPAPGDRFPTIEDLLAAIEPSRSSRLGIAGAAALAGTVALFATASTISDDPGCEAFAAQSQDLWAATQPAIETHFTVWKADYAGALHERFEARVDAIVEAWSDEAARYCAVDTKPPRKTEAQVEVCLSDRLAELSAALHLLAEGGEASLERSIRIVSIVGDPSFCAHDRWGEMVLTADPQLQQEAGRLRAQLYEARAHAEAGHYIRAEEIGRTVLAEATTQSLPAVEVEARYVLGNAQTRLTKVKEASASLEAAYFGARAIGHERIAAVAATSMVNIAGRQLSDVEMAERWGEWADASLKRLGDPGPMRASFDYAVGMAAFRGGRLDVAEERYQAALEAYQEHDDRLSMSACLSNLAEVRRTRGKPAEALPYIEEALRLSEAAVGSGHPSTTRTIGTLGLTQSELGDFESARESLATVVSRERATLGPRSPDVASALINLSTVECSSGQFEPCHRHNEEAASIIAEQLDDRHPFYAIALDNAAYALTKLGKPDEAVRKHEEALKIQQQVLPVDHPQLATTHGNLGTALALVGRHDAARRHLDDALRVAHLAWGRDHVKLAAVHLHRGTAIELAGQDGREELRSAVSRAAQMPPGPVHAEAMLALAKAEQRHGGTSAAVETLRTRARALYEGLGHRPGVAEADALGQQ